MAESKYQDLADQIRNIMVDHGSQHANFHLASGLGVVELCVALHEVFNFQQDKVFFDVGHQRYPHLILSEQEKHGVLRLPPEEIPYDLYTYAGLAGLSISSALGYALSSPQARAIAVVGDGAFTAGENYEALNHLGAVQKNVIVILNHNDMSIVKNVGAYADGSTVKEFAESLHFTYRGICNGHDVTELMEVLREIKDINKPVFLHIKTTKGKGYIWAEKYPVAFHQPCCPFDKKSGRYLDTFDEETQTIIDAFEVLEKKAIQSLAASEDFYLLCPSIPVLERAQKAYFDRVIDTGISEQHCMTLGTTLANFGKNVLLLIYGAFLTRCYSQIFDLCHQCPAMTVVINFAGANLAGPTHQALHVFNMLRIIPNAVIMAPCNVVEFAAALDFAPSVRRPVFIIMPKENPRSVNNSPVTYGCGEVLNIGDRVTVVPVGAMFNNALQLAAKYPGLEILNPRFVKPFDYNLLLRSIAKTKKLLLLEEGLQKGGVSEEIMAYLQQHSIDCTVKCVSGKDIFTTKYEYCDIYGEYGIEMSVCEVALREFY